MIILRLKIRTLWRVILLFFYAIPWNCFFELILSMALMAYYVFTVKITAQLFESVGYYYQVENSNFAIVIKYVVLFVAMRLVQSLIIFLNGLNTNVYVYRKATNHFRQRLSKKAAMLSLISYEDAHINDMIERAQDIVVDERLSDLFIAIVNILNGFFSVLGIMIVLVEYSPWLLLLGIPSVVPFFVIRLIRGKEFYKMKYFQAKTKRNMDYYWSLLFDKKSMKEIRTYAFSDYIREKWSCYRDDVDEKDWNFKYKDSLSMLLADFISTGGYLLSVVLTIYLLLKGQINIGVLGACLSAFLSMQTYTKKFLISVGNVFEGVEFSKDYIAFIDLPDAANGAISLKKIPERIELKNVCFRYPNNEKYVIKNVCLQINKGERVVIVGENGSGKSTLLRILLGLYECDLGQVLFDEIPFSKIQKESFYNMISFMSQNPLQHKATVREAVALSDSEAIEGAEKIMAALRLAKIEYILDEKGLNTRLGKEFGGKELSLGEWQKIALARAFVRNSELVVLDEPTSAIDPITEMDILNTFLDNFDGRTCIIVSHRMGICVCADKVILLKDGEIAECGSHHELMDKRGEYYAMFVAQAQNYK